MVALSISILLLPLTGSAETTNKIPPSDGCQLALSLNVTPDFLISPPDSVANSSDFLIPPSDIVPKSTVSGSFSSNERCKAPFTLKLLHGIPNGEPPEPPVIIDVSTKNGSYSFKKDTERSGDFHLSVVDSCGSSNAVTVSNCSVDGGNVSKEAFSRMEQAHTCYDPKAAVVKTGLFESSKASPGGKTQFNSNDRIPTKTPTVSDIVATSVDFDPDYVKETIRDRKYTPKQPFSPLDVLQVKITVKVPGCKPNLADLRNAFFTGTLVTTDAKGKKLSLTSGRFSLLEPYTGDNPTFIMRLPLAPFEDIISAIASGRPISIEMHDKTSESKSVSVPVKDIPIEMTNCAQTYGSGKHRIVGMYDGYDHKENAISGVVSYFNQIRKDGFAKIEPYASSQSFFSYFVDLKKVVGGTISPITQINTNIKQANFIMSSASINNTVLSKYINSSSCQNGVYLLRVNTTNNSLGMLGGIALLGGSIRGALIDLLSAQMVADSRDSPNVSVVYVHEFSHTFAGLNDEYIYRGESVDIGIPLRNCSVHPSIDFSYKGKLYGSTKYEGCSFYYDVGKDPSTPKIPYYRPSNESIMNTKGDQFNVLSCANIFVAIKGGDAKSYFPKCANMKGIIKDGVEKTASVSPSPFAKLLSWIGVADIPTASLTADAVAVLPSRAGTKVKIVVPDTKMPPAGFEPLPKGVKFISDLLQCADESQRQPNATAYQEYLAQAPKCATGVADATALQEKSADLERSVAVIQTFIDSLKLSAKETKEMTTLDGASFVIIPQGAKQDKEYEQATGIAMKCMQDVSNSQKTLAPVGAISLSKGAPYAEITPELIEKVKAVKGKIEKSYQAFLKESAKDRGTVTNSTLNRLVLLSKTLEDSFALVTANAFSTYHQYAASSGNSIPLSVALAREENGKKKECASISTWAQVQIKAEGVKGAFVSSAVTLDGKTFAPDCIPETHLLGELKAGIAKNLTTFEKLKAEYEKQIKETKGKLDVLETAKYNCSATDTSTSNPPIRKSRSSGSSAAETVAGATQGSSSEPSYLIVESFDPKDPWGEIIEVTPNEVDSFAPLHPLSPQSGDSFNAGDLQIVKWSGGIPNKPVRMSLWRGRASGSTGNQLIQGITTPNDGSEAWVIPHTVSPGFFFIELSCLDKTSPNCIATTSSAFRVAGVELDKSGMDVDLKVNNSDKPTPVKKGSKITLSWKVAHVGNCYPNWPTSAFSSIREDGSMDTTFESDKQKFYELVCYNEDNNFTKKDSVVVTPIR